VILLCIAGFGRPALAELRFVQPEVDLGKVLAGKPLKHTFSFVNSGANPVEIVEARASCGCLAPVVTQQVCAPGKTGVIRLDINTLSQPAGRNTWRVTVTQRSGDQTSENTLSISADLEREIEVQPTAVTLVSESALAHEIVVTDSRERPFKVTEARSTSSRLSVRVAEHSRNADGKHCWKIELRMAGDCSAGRYDEAVMIYTDDPDYPELKVPVTIVKQSAKRLMANPSRVTLLAAIGQAVPSRLVLIRAAENQTVIIDRITVDHPAIVTSWAPGPGNCATVKISVNRGRVAGTELKSNIHIHVSKPFQETPVHCSEAAG
jgi:hypothetical protein